MTDRLTDMTDDRLTDVVMMLFYTRMFHRQVWAIIIL